MDKFSDVFLKVSSLTVSVAKEGKQTKEESTISRPGELAKRLRAMMVLPEDPGSVPSTCVETHNCL